MRVGGRKEREGIGRGGGEEEEGKEGGREEERGRERDCTFNSIV